LEGYSRDESCNSVRILVEGMGLGGYLVRLAFTRESEIRGLGRQNKIMMETGTKPGRDEELKPAKVQRSLLKWPHFAPDEMAAAVRALESGKDRQGRPAVGSGVAEAVGCKYGVALAGGAGLGAVTMTKKD
jgi:hypothetical protein